MIERAEALLHLLDFGERCVHAGLVLLCRLRFLSEQEGLCQKENPRTDHYERPNRFHPAKRILLGFDMNPIPFHHKNKRERRCPAMTPRRTPRNTKFSLFRFSFLRTPMEELVPTDCSKVTSAPRD